MNHSTKRPIGVWLFALAYALLAVLSFVGLVSMIPDSGPPEACTGLDCGNSGLINPWNSNWGVILVALCIGTLSSSIAALLGHRTGRSALTAILAISLATALVQEVRMMAGLLGIPACEARLGCAVSEWWRLASPLSWLPWLAWLLFHVWYFHGPSTRAFYSRHEETA